MIARTILVLLVCFIAGGAAPVVALAEQTPAPTPVADTELPGDAGRLDPPEDAKILGGPMGRAPGVGGPGVGGVGTLPGSLPGRAGELPASTAPGRGAVPSGNAK